MLGNKETIKMMPNEGKLVTNDIFEHKVYQYGNYPINQDAKPKNGMWRLKLRPEADWTAGRQGTKEELEQYEAE